MWYGLFVGCAMLSHYGAFVIRGAAPARRATAARGHPSLLRRCLASGGGAADAAVPSSPVDIAMVEAAAARIG